MTNLNEGTKTPIKLTAAMRMSAEMEMEILAERLDSIGSELIRLRAELAKITEWDKHEFQQSEIRMHESAQFRVHARLQGYQIQLNNTTAA